jgi:multicomponent Na+:H+ antiporter subunit E
MHWAVRAAPFLGVFWLLLSGHYTPLLLVLGALSVVLVLWLSVRAGLVEHARLLPLALRLPGYLAWLAGQVLLSSVAVVRQVWSPRPDLSPVVGSVPAPDMNTLARVTYANSITLTPGTLTLAVEADHLEVHSLQAADLEGLREGFMLRRVRRLEPRR